VNYFNIGNQKETKKVAVIKKYLDKHPRTSFGQVADHFSKLWNEPIDPIIVEHIGYTSIFHIP
jgi:hypothetical protein